MLPVILEIQAEELYRAGNLEAASGAYARLCALDPDNAAPHYMLGIIKAQQGHYDEALRLIEAAHRFSPSNPVILSSRATVLNTLGRREEALSDCKRALEFNPQSVEAFIARGNILFALDRYEEALASYDSAISNSPRHAPAWSNRAIALRAMKRYEEALEASTNAIAIHPKGVDALFDRANTLCDLERFDCALTDYDKALAINPTFAKAWSGRGYALLGLNRVAEALDSCDKALALDPSLAMAWDRRGTALFRLRYFDGALRAHDQALMIEPDCASAWTNKGHALRASNNLQEALLSYERALSFDPRNAAAFTGMAIMALTLCDWQRTETIRLNIGEKVRSGFAISPFVMLGYSDDNELILQSAKNTAIQLTRAHDMFHGTRTYPVGRRIRVAYLSSNFNQHPVAFQIAELLELHSRHKFEIYAISTGIDDDSAIRKRIAKAVEHFVDVHEKTDRAVAEFLLQNDIDILIDLNGHTDGAGLSILAHRPCPVQVSWLGYPGTVGSDFIDYIIADEIVAPTIHGHFYSEKLVHLPDTFFASDPTHLAAITLTREDERLPNDAFVFCCFNATWKLNRPIFEVWMRLLANAPRSVLWLKECPLAAKQNLIREVASLGIEPERIIFAQEVDRQVHLARHRLADLFLDTLPYNAHATACDALWAGLPVLTCLGQSFAGRVASSLLSAVGMEELITNDLAEYEAKALELANDAIRLGWLRRKLETGVRTGALFDTKRFRSNLESAFAKMVTNQQNPDVSRFACDAK